MVVVVEVVLVVTEGRTAALTQSCLALGAVSLMRIDRRKDLSRFRL